MPEQDWIKVTAPPTVANMAVGFDILGMAVDGQGDLVELALQEETGVRIRAIEGDGGALPRDAERNTATAGIIAMLERMEDEGRGIDRGIQVRLNKRMPLGSGMGSSASSAAAGVFGANELLGRPFEPLELAEFALIGEAQASGVRHGDNVLPALYGGMILIRQLDPLDIIQLPIPDGLVVLLIHPHVEVMTSESRKRLDNEVPMGLHIAQSADLAAFIHAVHTNDLGLIGRSMNDRIVGPQRQSDIPHFHLTDEVVKSHDALNYDISGSGPSSFAFFSSMSSALDASAELEALIRKGVLEADLQVLRPDSLGARSIESEE